VPAFEAHLGQPGRAVTSAISEAGSSATGTVAGDSKRHIVPGLCSITDILHGHEPRRHQDSYRLLRIFEACNTTRKHLALRPELQALDPQSSILNPESFLPPDWTSTASIAIPKPPYDTHSRLQQLASPLSRLPRPPFNRRRTLHSLTTTSSAFSRDKTLAPTSVYRIAQHQHRFQGARCT